MCGNERASHTVLSPASGGVEGIVVSIDVPSKATGTGEHLVADGEDTALVRASLVDSRGVVVPGASNNVTFAVVSGAGRIWATHSGDPANLSPSHAPWTPAYGGWVSCNLEVQPILLHISHISAILTFRS